jgi:two-component system phosphate regulon sensor histidine kinase PhoR
MKKSLIPSNISNLSQLLEDGLVLCNKAGSVLYFNNLAKQYLGKILNEKKIYELIPTEELKDLDKSHQKGIFNDQFNFQTEDVLKRSLIIKVKKIEDNLYGILLLDMTLQRNLEKVRRDFVANVSHELRSPLTSLVGFIETMLNGQVNDAETQQKFLYIMDEEAKRMTRLIDDILSLSKVETEEHISPNTSISILNPIQYVMSSIKERGLSNNHNLIFEDTRLNINDPCFVIGNIDEINQIFVNLLENAIKYSYKETEIVVRIEQYNPKEVVIRVINKGEVIPEKYLDRLTERFFRVDKARSRELGGTGLGLAIVKHILIRHRATLNITSKHDGVTTFSITFPLSPK